MVSEVLGHYSIADIADARELTPTIDGDAKNWAQVMLNRIAHYLLRHESFDRVLELFNDTGSDGVLSILVENASAKREKDLVNAILFHPDGTLKEKYVNTTDKKLLENIFNLLDFNAAFDLFCSIDIDRLVSANHRQVRNEQIYIDESLRHTASLYFSLLLQKVENFTDFDTAFSILEARNAVRIQEGKTPFYRSDFERYFLFPKKYAWKLLSENITSHDLRKVFTAIYATPLPEGTSPADDISLTRTEIFNYLLDQMDLDQALPTWEDMRNVRDSFSLVQILGKAPDFSIAKGLMDSFISGGVGKHVRIGIRAVNALLATTQDISDATECVKYFRSIGYLPASTDPGVPDCFADLLDIDDMYTQGILAARDFIGFNSRCRILRRHVNPSVVRNEGTLTHVVYKAPGFEAAEEILFGTPDFITSDEQKLLRNSPVALSWLAGRTFSSDRKDDLDRRIHQVIQTARGEDSLQDIFDPSTANIINEYIGNRNLTPTYEDALTAIDRFTAELGFSPANDFTCTKLMWRYVEADRPREEKIRRVNEHVLSQSHMRRSHVRQNTLLRYLLADRRKSYPAVSLTHTEAYPFVESTGEWTLREITTVDYVRNMMDHRFLHPLALFYALKGLLDNILAGKDRDRNISVFKDLVERARKNRIFITQRLIVSLLDKMAGVRGLDIDLRPIAGDYSIIQDLCDRLESGAITPRRAMAELESYRQRHPIGIYIPAKFYNRIAQSLAKDERLTVTDHLDIFRTRDGLSSFTVCPLMHAVRSFDEYLSVKELWGKPLLPMFYKAFPSVLQKMSEAGSQNEADLIIRDCLGWDGYRFTTPVPIANTLAIRIAGFWSEKDAATLIGIFARSGYCDSTDTTAAPENDADNYDDLDDTPEETYDSTSQQLLLRPRTPEELIAILEYAAIHSENIKASFLLNRLMETRPSSVQAERIVDLITGGGIPGVQKNNFHFVLLAVKNWGFDIGMLRGLIDRCSIVLDSSDFYSALHIIDTLDDYLFLRGHYTGTFQSRHCDMIMKRINHRSGEKAVFRHDLFGHFNTPDHIAIFSRLAAADPRLRRAIERNHTLIALAVLLLIAVGFGVTQVASLKSQVQQAQLQNEELRLDNEQLQLSNEFDVLNAEFQQYEDQAQRLANDTILAKYTAAKAKVEQLMNELKNEKVKSSARIKELQNEISTLKGLLRHYIAQIDSLNKENAGLKAENEQYRTQNERISSRLQEETRKNENLSERMTLAEKLNVTGVSLTPLNKKGKLEKKVKKAKQLMVTFTIPQNNSTPVGEKAIFMRLISPEGQLLGGAGSFPFEGKSIPCSARKTIEYAGDEIAGIKIYWDVNTALSPGDYTVELFTDGYRLASRHFTLK
ncbi:MAG: hypothetical protein HFJ91_09210 [Muribaculaceae bacterium]|nr:hypothetical protein [Muribaculaceae bacterium]